MLKVFDRLANGALILAIRPIPNYPGAGFVLALFRDHEFVTWMVSELDGDCYHGHYFQEDLLRAVADYTIRT